MAKDDYWDRLGKLLDPFGSYDYNGDGVHDWWETTDAEIDEERIIEEAENKRRRRTSILDDDIDDDGNFIDDDLDDEDEDSASDVQMYDKFGFELDEYDPDGTYDEYGNLLDEDGDIDVFADKVKYEDEDDDDDEENDERVVEEHTTITISFHVADDGENLPPDEQRKHEAQKHIEYLSKKKKLDDYDITQKKRCELILKDDCIASRYISISGGFEWMDAIIAEIGLPKEYTDNYDIDDNLFVNLERIKDYDLNLLYKILRWLYNEFYPYQELDDFYTLDKVVSIFISFSNVEEDTEEQIYKFICENSRFFAGVISESDDGFGYHLEEILFKALSRGDKDLVFELAVALLKNKKMKHMSKLNVFEGLLTGYCIYQLDTVAVRNFLSILYPMLEEVMVDVSKRKIDSMKRKIDEYLSSCDDEDEEDEPEPEKVEYDWRKQCSYPNPYNLNPADFLSHTEFTIAFNKAAREEREHQIKAARAADQKGKMSDPTIYELYGVYFEDIGRYYYYLAGGKRIKIGDAVVVPFGADNKEVIGTVICIKKTKRLGIQYPIDKIKNIIKKVPDDLD